MNRPEKIKELQKTIRNSEATVKAYREQIAYMQPEIARHNAIASQARNTLRQLTSLEEGVRVSDHAVLRYLERMEGMDIGSIRKMLGSACPAGNGDHGYKDGILRVKDGMIVTVLLSKNDPS